MSLYCVHDARAWTCIDHSNAFSTSSFEFIDVWKNTRKWAGIVRNFFFESIALNGCRYCRYLRQDDYGECTTTFALQSSSTTGEKWKVQNGLAKVDIINFEVFYQFMVKFIYRDFLVGFFCAQYFVVVAVVVGWSVEVFGCWSTYWAASSYLFSVSVWTHVFSIRNGLKSIAECVWMGREWNEREEKMRWKEQQRLPQACNYYFMWKETQRCTLFSAIVGWLAGFFDFSPLFTINFAA